MAIKMSQGLKLKQTQGLSMTPQLQQAIKMLTLNHLEMSAAISKELVENPTIEEINTVEESKTSTDDNNLENLEYQAKETKADNFEDKEFKGEDDFDWQKYVETYNNTSSTGPSLTSSSDEDRPDFENMVSKGESLCDHLEWQLRMGDLSNDEWEIAQLIIYNINDDGYLSHSFEEIIHESKKDRGLCFSVKHKIQQLDPIGCGSETLSECLLVQAQLAEERSPLLEKIILHHLDDLKNRQTKKMAKEIGVTEDAILAAAKLLHEFYPKPGRLVASAETHYVTPDVYVVKVGSEFVVQVNDDGIPRLRISRYYQELLNSAKTNSETAKYVQEKIKSAVWLLKSIQHRQKTIYRVAKSIVSKQQDFFKKGRKYLVPMILKDVANEIGVHESTVSRVTSNKFMHTPGGMYELKYFFNTGVGGKNGGLDVSSEVLKIKIAEMIKAENPKKPLSDQKIAELLSREDVKLARRTVAKYRENLAILPSSKRKQR